MAMNPSSVISSNHSNYHSSFSVSVPNVSPSNIILYESYVEKGLLGEPICSNKTINQYQNYAQYVNYNNNYMPLNCVQ